MPNKYYLTDQLGQESEVTKEEYLLEGRLSGFVGGLVKEPPTGSWRSNRPDLKYPAGRNEYFPSL